MNQSTILFRSIPCPSRGETTTCSSTLGFQQDSTYNKSRTMSKSLTKTTGTSYAAAAIPVMTSFNHHNNDDSRNHQLVLEKISAATHCRFEISSSNFEDEGSILVEDDMSDLSSSSSSKEADMGRDDDEPFWKLQHQTSPDKQAHRSTTLQQEHTLDFGTITFSGNEGLTAAMDCCSCEDFSFSLRGEDSFLSDQDLENMCKDPGLFWQSTAEE